MHRVSLNLFPMVLIIQTRYFQTGSMRNEAYLYSIRKYPGSEDRDGSEIKNTNLSPAVKQLPG